MAPSLPATLPTTVLTASNLPIPTYTDPNTTALVNRLRSSSDARRTYNLQALLYSYGYTDAPPDGISGPVTQGLINSVNALTPGDLGNQYQRAHVAMLNLYGVDALPTRLVPNALPADVISLLNRDALALDSSAPLVQAYS